MDTEGASAMFGPLSFPERPTVLSQFSFDPWEAGPCICPLCDVQFILPKDKNFIHAHLYCIHKLVISDAHLLPTLKGYLDYWKVRFSQKSITDFCTTMTLEDQVYYLLSEVHPEDQQLRAGLTHKRLEWVLDCQRKEREDSNYNKGCLFCRYIETGSRADYLVHLSYQHNLQLGRPDNLVFVDQLIDKVEEKLLKLQCLYCDHVFKDRTVLKEHMRKKFHKRINPKNKEFDHFYIVNYVEGGQQKEKEDIEPEDSWSQWREEGSDWSDWKEEPSPIVCLFCPDTSTQWDDVLQHMSDVHRFSYKIMLGTYNFYEQVKCVNYLRREVHLCRCYDCKTKFSTREDLLEHMTELQHFTVPDRENWDHPEFFFPTYENDTFLSQLEDNEEETIEKLTSQMSSTCSMQPEAGVSGT